MISFFKKLKINKKLKFNKGMTYIELIVVLSIFSIMSSIILINYGKFQAKIDVKNLGNDIALKVVEAQKSALSGKLPPVTVPILANPWIPAYGLYFTSSPSIDGSDGIAYNKKFIYYADNDNDSRYLDPGCTGACLEKIKITKGNFIYSIDAVRVAGVSTHVSNSDAVSVTFTRPDSSAAFHSSDLDAVGSFDYLQITVSSPQGINAYVKIYPSGRIQIK